MHACRMHGSVFVCMRACKHAECACACSAVGVLHVGLTFMSRMRAHTCAQAHTHRRMYPDLSDEQLDAKRMYDKSYMTIYSELSKKKMLRKTLGKRKDHNQASEQADTP